MPFSVHFRHSWVVHPFSKTYRSAVPDSSRSPYFVSRSLILDSNIVIVYKMNDPSTSPVVSVKTIGIMKSEFGLCKMMNPEINTMIPMTITLMIQTRDGLGHTQRRRIILWLYFRCWRIQHFRSEHKQCVSLNYVILSLSFITENLGRLNQDSILMVRNT